MANSPRAQQRCSIFPGDRAPRRHHVTACPLWPSLPILQNLNFRYTQAGEGAKCDSIYGPKMRHLAEFAAPFCPRNIGNRIITLTYPIEAGFELPQSLSSCRCPSGRGSVGDLYRGFVESVDGAKMEADRRYDFACPRCQARYKTVGMQSEPGTVYRMLQCTVCQQELAPTEGDDILKYFLVSRPRPENRTSRTRGSQLKRS